MKKVIIFGASTFEERLAHIIKEQGKDEVVAFCVDQEYRREKKAYGYPVLIPEELQEKYSPTECEILVGLGYKEMNSIRAKKCDFFINQNYNLYNFIHDTVYIEPSVVLGQGNIIFANVTIDYRSNIGNGNIFEVGTTIAHECSIGNYNYFAPRVTLGGKVNVTNKSFWGIGSIGRSAIEVQESALIGAGAYVDKDVSASVVIVPQRSKALSKKSSEMNILYKGGKSWKEC